MAWVKFAQGQASLLPDVPQQKCACALDMEVQRALRSTYYMQKLETWP